jgi:hypothetical protein
MMTMMMMMIMMMMMMMIIIILANTVFASLISALAYFAHRNF